MQLSLFDWRPPPPPAPPRAARPPARRDVAEKALDVLLHERPDPRRVYALSVSHGYEAAAERWWWCSKSDLSRIISQGRALTFGTRSECVRRSLTPAGEQRIVDAVLELGGSSTPLRRAGSRRAWFARSCASAGSTTPAPRAAGRLSASFGRPRPPRAGASALDE